MDLFLPQKVYYEPKILEYEQGRQLIDKYSKLKISLIEIERHNKIEELRNLPDSEFINLKKYLILGVRKSTRLIENNRSADFIVPFTSSGCSAFCLYCYLVCTFFKGSYLRVFVNRDDMMNEIKKKADKTGKHKMYEIGSNSDMLLENGITGNLEWAIEQFATIKNATCTFATKFAAVDSLLNLNHNGKTQMRISVNPEYIIKNIEFGTSSLVSRCEAANKMFEAGYKVGINIAPIILIDGWQQHYLSMFDILSSVLCERLKNQAFFELIFMTFGLANELINNAALPNAINVFDKSIMKPKGRGKYCYKEEIMNEGKSFLFNK
jgi:spore photoproduct lyase